MMMRQIPYSRISCDGNELAYIREVLESGWLTTAAKAQALELEFAQTLGVRFACAVNSCTSALHLGLEALEIRAGDRVLVPTMTFTASAEVIRYLGADPVFIDVEYGSSLITPEGLSAALDRDPGVKALIVVHFAGQPARMLSDADGPGILEICRRRGVRILEDAAHAFPTRCGERMVGGLGDATCFSFYANKTITTGEGGMLTTNDEAIAARARVMRLHGIDRDVWSRFTSTGNSWEYDVVAPGFKYNMPDINAAIGLAQLERAHAMRDSRQRIAARYTARLAGMDTIDLPAVRVPAEDHAWHLFVVVVRPESPIGRDQLAGFLAGRGIGTSVTYKPLHRMSYYRDRYSLDPGEFPEAERIYRGCLALPIYPSLTDDDVDYICDSLRDMLGDAGHETSRRKEPGPLTCQ
jgi:dTDP-4-amino-4,6-dideoxygalactose transaminase